MKWYYTYYVDLVCVNKKVASDIFKRKGFVLICFGSSTPRLNKTCPHGFKDQSHSFLHNHSVQFFFLFSFPFFKSESIVMYSLVITEKGASLACSRLSSNSSSVFWTLEPCLFPFHFGEIIGDVYVMSLVNMKIKEITAYLETGTEFIFL